MKRSKPDCSLMLVGEAPAIDAGIPSRGFCILVSSHSSGCWLWWGWGCGREMLPPVSPLPTARTPSTTLPSICQGSWLLTLSIFSWQLLTHLPAPFCCIPLIQGLPEPLPSLLQQTSPYDETAHTHSHKLELAKDQTCLSE